MGGLVTSKAYILIKATVGKTRDVAGALRGLEGVSESHLVTGPYDIVAIVEGQDANAVGNTVTGRIHAIPGIARTVTCLRIEIP